MARYILILLFVPLSLFLYSCDGDSDAPENTDPYLAQMRVQIKSYVDSANFYYDKLFSEQKTGSSAGAQLYNDAGRIKFYHIAINRYLDNANLLSKQNNMSQAAFDNWVLNFNLSALKDKKDKLVKMGIDLDKIPAIEPPKAPAKEVAKKIDPADLPQEYVSAAGHFTLKLPASWQANEQLQKGLISVMVFGPGMANGNTKMSRNGAIGISIIDYPKEFTSEDFYAGNIASLKMGSKDFEIMKEEETDIAGIPAKQVVFKCSNQGIATASVNIYFFKDKKGYILNGTATIQEFGGYKDLYIAIMKTFAMK